MTPARAMKIGMAVAMVAFGVLYAVHPASRALHLHSQAVADAAQGLVLAWSLSLWAVTERGRRRRQAALRSDFARPTDQ
jgi:hypothetical protein